MQMSDYQRLAHMTSDNLDIGHPIIYPALGLASEAGEVCGKIKKLFRDHDVGTIEERREVIKKELGDTLWYLAEICTQMGWSLSDIARENIEKLQGRAANGTIHGNGDER